MNLRCPKCGNAYQLAVRPAESHLDCPGCEHSFSIDELLATSAVESVEKAGCELSPGSQFGHFAIRSQVASGVGAYDAEDVRLREKVTLNVASSYGSNQNFIDRAFTVSKIRDPKIATVREVGRAADTPYVVLDPVEGETLDKWIESYQPSDQQLCQVFSQIATALEVIHENGLIHRRLNMGSVRIDGDGNAKITDLMIGHSRDAHRDVSAAADPSNESAVGSETDGLPGELATIGTDIYSLGVLMEKAFTIRDAQRDAEGHDDTRFSRNAVIRRCKEASEKKRYRSAILVADDLERISNGLHPRDADLWATIKRQLGRLLNKNWVGLFAVPAIVLVAIAFQNLNAPVTDFKDTLSVVIYSEVSGARIVAVPVFVQASPADGLPVVNLRETESGYYEGELEPGFYCLEIQPEKGLPFCVYRRVPGAGVLIKTAENCTQYSRLPTGEIELASVEIGKTYWAEDGTPEIDGLEFASVPGGVVDSTYENPGSPENGAEEKYIVQGFEMSTTEVTWGVYSRVMGVEPEGNLDEPVTGITYFQAHQFCELTRTRLPMQIEYIAALTESGETPSRLELPPGSVDDVWGIGPVKCVVEDKTDHPKPIFGLFSNAFELTSDCVQLDNVPSGMPGIAPEMAKVFGGPAAVLVSGTLDPNERIDVKKSTLIPLMEVHKKIGFRVVKSTEPRFRGFKGLVKNSPK